MLEPSIDSLLEKVPSKYLLVTVAARRAREMANNNDPLLKGYVSKKHVGKALEEIQKDELIVEYIPD